MNSDNSDPGSRGTIRFIDLGYPGNIAIASIQSQHDLMPFRIAVDVSMIPMEKMSTDATFLIMVKNFSRRVSLMKISMPNGENFRAIWLLDTESQCVGSNKKRATLEIEKTKPMCDHFASDCDPSLCSIEVFWCSPC